MLRSLGLALLLVPALVLGSPEGFAQERDEELRDARASQVFVAGMTRAYIGDHEGAIALYQRALELAPDRSAILAALAESYQARGDLSAALFHAERAVEAAPREASLYRLLADLRRELGDVQGVAEALRVVTAILPGDAALRTDLARAQHHAGQLEEALQSYREVLDMVGESAPVRARMLQIYRRLGDLDGAVETTRVLLALDPEQVGLYQQLAEMESALGRDEEAAAALETLLEIDPGNASARDALAAMYRERGDETSAEALTHEEIDLDGVENRLARAASLYVRSGSDPAAARSARELLESLLHDDEAPVEALLMLGDLRFRERDFRGAVSALSAALAAQPAHLPAWEQLIIAHLELGDSAAATDMAAEALLLFPGQYPLLRASVHALMQEERNPEAARAAAEAADVLRDEHPESVEELSHMVALQALVYMRLEDAAQSDSLHEEAIALDPDNAMALNNFAYDLAGRGVRLDDALAMAQRAVELAPENTSFLDTRGWVHHVRGEHGLAIEWLARAAEIAEAQGVARAIYYEHLGEAQAAAGETEAALRSFRRALELEPNRGHIRQRIAELE